MNYVIDDGQNKIPGYSQEETDAAIDAAASNLTNLSDAYDETATYAVGDYCIHDNQLYKCTTSIATAEAWNAAHWTATNIGNELEIINSAMAYTTDNISSASTYVNVNRGNFWKIGKLIFCCGVFTLTGAANSGLNLMKLPAGITVPSAFDLAFYGADNKVYNGYSYHGNIVANTTMPAQVYTFNFAARIN